MKENWRGTPPVKVAKKTYVRLLPKREDDKLPPWCAVEFACSKLAVPKSSGRDLLCKEVVRFST